MKRLACLALTSLLFGCDDMTPVTSESDSAVLATTGAEGSSESGSETTSDDACVHTATTGAEPTTGEGPLCAAIAPSACRKTAPAWCGEVEAFCKQAGLGESKSPTDFCGSIGDWCEFGADPCKMCSTLEQTCIDELKPGESVELCFGIVAECMCLGIAHGEQF